MTKISDRRKLVLASAFGVVLSVVLLSSIVASTTAFYSFSISMPDEIVAKPGDTVAVNGEILVTGMYWLHRFELKLDGLKYDYNIEPAYWQDVRILREWNPQQGVYRIPENFTITINVPMDANGLQVVTVAGQEHHSWREVANSTFFVLKIEGKPSVEEPAKIINVTDILVPETINESEPFNITFRVNNEGMEKTAVVVSILAPVDWKVEQKTQYLDIAGGDSAAGIFRLTPTASAGTVSLYLEYPYKQEIVNFTRVGPYLQPATTTTTLPTTTTTAAGKPLIVEFYENIKAKAAEVWGSIKDLAGPMLGPFTIGIIVVLVVVIAWLMWGIVKDMRAGKAKSEEEMKKQLDSIKSSIFNESGVDKL